MFIFAINSFTLRMFSIKVFYPFYSETSTDDFVGFDLFSNTSLMASSKIYLRPSWVRAEHSRYVQFCYETSALAFKNKIIV